MRQIVLFLLLCCLLTVMPQIKPLKYGHAHNYYLHKRPLLDALELGFISIEIDLYYIYKRAKVSHTPILLCMEPQLKPLYFDPLHEIISKNGGTVFPDD